MTCSCYLFYHSTKPELWTYWSKLKLTEELFYLNLVIGSSIAIGLSSFILDVIVAWCKAQDWRSHNWGALSTVVDWFLDDMDREAGFWDRAVLFEGLSH